MGVTGLWKLIESSGKPVPVETLENKVLAIDLSIWLHQVVKGFQDNKGGNLPNAHLLGLFHRLCKLLYYRVKPVFVFDGGVPQLKRDTIAKRSQSRNKIQSEADRIQELILQNLVRDKVVQKALGEDVCESLISPSKQKPPEKPHKDDMFKLPCLKVENHIYQDDENASVSSNTDISETDSSYDEKNLRSTYHVNLQAIDVTSEHFKNLPADVRHEILTDIKDMRKQSSWGRLNELPPAAYDFSGFQMKRLLKRRQVQVSLEEAEQQMEGKSLTLAELEALMSEEGILNIPNASAARRIASDENTRFLLVKDLKRAYENAQKNADGKIKKEESDIKNVKKEDNEEIKEDDERLGRDYDLELQKAIALSLETTQVYKDNDYDENPAVKLNNAQREELKTAANSLARAYMIEYAGMTDEEIRDMVQDEEVLPETRELQASFNFQHNDRFILKGEICTPYKDIPALKEKNTEQLTKKSLNLQMDEKQEEVQYISSSDDSDLEEVNETPSSSNKNFEIIVDPTKRDEMEDDLFADIFEDKEPENSKAEVMKPVSEEENCKTVSAELSEECISDTSLNTASSYQKVHTKPNEVNAEKINEAETNIKETLKTDITSEIPKNSNSNEKSESPLASEAQTPNMKMNANQIPVQCENELTSISAVANITSEIEEEIRNQVVTGATCETGKIKPDSITNAEISNSIVETLKISSKITEKDSNQEIPEVNGELISNVDLRIPEGPISNIIPKDKILSPELNRDKTKEILDKLRAEMNKVQSITLDAIELSDELPLEKLPIVESPKAETLENSTTRSIPVEKTAAKVDICEEPIKNTVDKNSVMANEDTAVEKIASDGNIDAVKSIKRELDTASPESMQVKVENDAEVQKSTLDLSKIKTNISSSAKSPPKLDEILKYVKQQTSEVVNISLDDITPVINESFLVNESDDSDVEIISTPSKNSVAQSSQNPTSEIIEILDDQSNGLKTPVKISGSQSSINDFFQADFAIKRTPEKANEKEESPPPPNVVSPFFVNKSSSGGKKRPPISNSEAGPSKGAKVSKQLFEEESKTEIIESEAKPVDSIVVTEADVIEEAAKVLRGGKTQSELEDIATDIRKKNKELEMERNRQNRMASSITDKMAYECKQLLRLFGVPYIVAPMEAEAQCAFLDLINLTDGTITDDSDVWLFGGQTVYKNFFNQKKHVLEFKIENIEKLFNMDRHKLIQLAMLVGSDYTTGINGIGAVTAIEILANFPITPMKEGEVTEIMSILSSLRKFRDWWQACKITKGGERSALRSKLKNVDLHEGFPNMNIVEAYLRPTVDDSREKFTWGEPDIETIREFAKSKFGWTRVKTDEILQPVLKKLQERKTQASIKNYFAVKSATTVRELKVSKRVMTAIDKMSGDYVEPPPKQPKERKTRKKKAPAKKPTEEDPALENEANNGEVIDLDDVESSAPKSKQRRTCTATSDQNNGVNQDDANNAENIIEEVTNNEDTDVFATPAEPKKKPVTRKRGANKIETESDNVSNIPSIEKVKPPKLPGVKTAKKKIPILPNPNQPIPQREKDKKEMELKKQKAIEIFKQKKATAK